MNLPRYTPIELGVTELQDLLRVAHLAADAAATVTCRYFRQSMRVDNKAGETGFDPVTVADREAELAIRDVLISHCPEIGFFGEEHEVVVHDNALLWVVDPIDGTRAFVSGMPLWGTLIGLYNGENAVLGLMDQPVLCERYVGYGNCAQLLGSPTGSKSLPTPLLTRREPRIEQAVAYCTTPDMFVEPAANACFVNFKNSVKLMRYGGDCYAYTLLAGGFVDIVIDCDLQPYDIAALIPIIEAAGGIVTSWSGGRAVDGGYVVACGSRELHDQVVPLLQLD